MTTAAKRVLAALLQVPQRALILVVQSLVGAAVADETGPIAGRDPGEIIALLGERTGPERLIDLMLRTGPYGDGFGANPDGLSLDVLLATDDDRALWLRGSQARGRDQEDSQDDAGATAPRAT